MPPASVRQAAGVDDAGQTGEQEQKSRAPADHHCARQHQRHQEDRDIQEVQEVDFFRFLPAVISAYKYLP